MRKTGVLILFLLCAALSYFTFLSAEKVFQPDWQMPGAAPQEVGQHRLVLITRNLETPFWDKVAAGASLQAEKEGANLEVWGSYSNNKEDFLERIELALHSKVDGIILQGLDTEEFKALTKVTASSYGIPIITVSNDVPVEESLRKTYVGSDQFEAGRMIAAQLIEDMGTEGQVVLMSESGEEFYQQQRLAGLRDILNEYADIEMIHTVSRNTKQQIIATTQDTLNKFPDIDSFIAVDADFTGTMLQEIEKRSQVEPYHIYSFDDGQEYTALLDEGKLDGILVQSPEKMGETGVRLMVEWLTDESVPLEIEGHLTDIYMLKAEDLP